MKRVAMSLVFLFLVLPVNADVIRVPADQPTIQAGIDAAVDGDMVLVADGTYTGVGNWALDTQGKTITVASQNGPEDCIIDCGESGERAFAIQSGEGPGTVIEGFTTTGGVWEYEDTWVNGGGILVVGSSPVIRGNRLVNNVAEYGAGIRCIDGSDPLIEDNHIADNHAALNGGGISCGSSCSPTIRGNTIQHNAAGHFTAGSGFGGGIYCGGGTVLDGNLITLNIALDSIWNPPSIGGGVYAYGESTIINNQVSENSASYIGSGISGTDSPLITGNTFTGNQRVPAVSLGFVSTVDGGAVTHNLVINNPGGGVAGAGPCLIANNLVAGNGFDADYPWGDGIQATGDAIIRSCTIAGNRDAAISIWPGSDVLVADTILWGNNGSSSIQIHVQSYSSQPSSLTISHSDIQGGQSGIETDPDATVTWGAGMIDANPLFVDGPFSFYYLSQTAAGQGHDSPCIDTGSGPASDLCFPAEAGDRCLDQLSTRSDLAADLGTADIGFHFPPPAAEPDTVFTGGPYDSIDSPVLNITWSGTDETDPASDLLFSWCLDSGPWSEWSPVTWTTLSGYAIGVHSFEVHARDSDGNVDPTPAMLNFSYEAWTPTDDWQGLVTGPGPEPFNPPLVRTWQAEWLAYDVMRHGVNLAAGDIDGDGTDEVITGAGPGPVFGPHVRCFKPDGSIIHGAGFLAYGTHKWGVNVAAGDIDGDGYDEIVTGAGPGPVFGPHVRGWNRDSGSAWQPIPTVSFFAYGTPKWGVNVACGDIDGDGIDEIITGAGPGPVYGAHVRGWNWDGGGAATPIPGVSYFAYGTPQWGVNVACGDIDVDGRDEIITGPGPGPAFGAHVRGWDFDGSVTTPKYGVSFFADPAARCGAVVACGDTDGDGRDEIVVTLGPSPSNLSTCRLFNYVDSGISQLRSFQPFDAWMTHGARVAVGSFD